MFIYICRVDRCDCVCPVVVFNARTENWIQEKKEVELLKREKELKTKEEKSNTKEITEVKATKKVNEKIKNKTQQVKGKGTKTEIDAKYLISKNGVGFFQIGQKAPTTFPKNFDIEKKSYIEQNNPDLFGEKIIYFQVTENGNNLLTYKMGYDNTISEISIISEKIKTNMNIGIDSKIVDFQKAYPNYQLWEQYEGMGWLGMSTKQLKASFLLDQSDFLGKSEQIGDMIKLSNINLKRF